MKKSRIICGIIAICLITSAFYGCTGGSSTSSAATASPIGASSSSSTSGDSVQNLSTDDIFKEKDVTVDYDEGEAVNITLNGETATTDSNDGVAVDGGKITITQKGIYVFSGTLDNGQIIVNCADEKADVRIILNNANITCSHSAPIYVMAADNAIITLKSHTSNTLTDGEAYSVNEDDEPNSCIFSKADLTINGAGALTVTGSYNNGITSKDDLKLVSGTIAVTAKDDGIVGKDLVAVQNADITVNSQDDGIKASNETDADSGVMYIENGTFNITAQSDALRAVSALNILNGTFKLTTGGGSVNSSSKQGQEGNSWGDWRGDGNTTTAAAQDTESAKGIKATDNVTIDGGVFTVDSSDDSVHSNGNVEINNGKFTISSGDDGIHADGSVTINDGTIDIIKSYEGIEGSNITVNNGTINLVSYDDGFNVAGGADSSAQGDRPGQGSFSSSSGALTFNGGTVYVNADGDGLDSNGSISMTGGAVTVDGPTNDGNGALDYDSDFTLTGGNLICSGSSGMAQAPGTNSTQLSIMMSFTSYQNANSVVVLKDSSGNEVSTHTPAKNFNNIVISASALTAKENYSLWVDGTQVVEFTLSSDAVTYLNESGVTTGNAGGMGGGRGGNMGGDQRPAGGPAGGPAM